MDLVEGGCDFVVNVAICDETVSLIHSDAILGVELDFDS
jgi:hypothetical protein